ncbi:MAG: c-type cytochrome [Gemmatimonadales bacterium]|nr:c-type cytochrome [Gemmatimonadales bacterium]
MTRKAALYVMGGALGATLLGAVGMGVFVVSGRYDIAAMHPHTRPVGTVLKFLQRRSIAFHARSVAPPRLDQPPLVRRGLTLYRQHCVICHGAPGKGRQRAGIGLNPTPPPLEQAIERWSDAEIYWTTAYGLKMAGMPSFLLGRTPEELWAIVAFVRQMNRLSPEEYRRMVRAAADPHDTVRVRWVGGTRAEALARVRGDPARGKELLSEFGCRSCHIIPGVRGPGGDVGPPLTRWAERQFISGRLVNMPAELRAWILDPLAVDSGTVMPAVGATVEQAQDMAAYLYTLGARPRERLR